MQGELVRAAQLTALIAVVVSGCNDSTPITPTGPTGPAPDPVATVALVPDTATLETGQHLVLSAQVRDGSGSLVYGRQVAWSSNRSAVATVSSSGLVTAVAAGVATIVATSEGKSGSMTITVVPTRVAKVIISPDSVIMWVAGQQALSSQLEDSAGRVVSGRLVSWSSSDPRVATVSPTGLVTGLADGTATVAATCEGQQGSATIVVLKGYLFVPDSSDLAVNGTLQLTAVPEDPAGKVITGGPVDWSSSDPTIATVDPASGLVRGLTIGNVRITASAQGLRSSWVDLTIVSLPAGLVETALGDLGGGQSVARAISDAGVVVGWSRTPTGDTHAFRWTAGGGMQDLGTLGGTTATATAINNAGDIVGYSTVASGQSHAFRWTASSGMQDLGVFPGGYESAAYAINITGEVGGESSGHAVRWSPTGTMKDLGTGGGQAQVLGINDASETVGNRDYEYCQYYCYSGESALIWDAAGNGADLNLGSSSTAEDINNLGQIVGQSDDAYRISASGLEWLQVLGQGQNNVTDAHALNESGDAVGTAWANSGRYHPVLWMVAGGVAPLSALPGDALGLNNVGQVVGYTGIGPGTQAKLWTLPSQAGPSPARVRVSR